MTLGSASPEASEPTLPIAGAERGFSEFSEAIGEAEAFAKGALSGRASLVRLDVLLADRLLLPTFPAPTADR